MSSEPTTRRGHSLALRLTLWYSGIFASSCLLAFALVYGRIVATVEERLDQDLSDDVAELADLYQSGGQARVEHEMRLDTKGEEAEKSFFRLWTRGGQLVLATDLAAFPGLGPPAGSVFGIEDAAEPVLETLDLPGRDHPVRAVYGPISSDLVVEIGESVEDDEEFVATLLRGFVSPLLAFVLLGLPAGWFLARRALRGVEDVTRTAREIAAGALDQRVAVQGEGDELARLAQVFNAMLDRIQGLVVGLRDMADHLAHDLRSPLTRIRTAAEMAQAGAPGGAEATLASTATEECDRLLELINTNLEITETESGAAHLEHASVDLVELVRDACELFQTVAEDRQVKLTAALPAQCELRGDRQRLQRVIANLLDNALKYTPAGGQVSIALVDEGPRVRLCFEDSGVGISAEERVRIFERFYRSDRSRSQPGNGLGLALCLASVRAHGGEISVESEPGRGSRFIVSLPR